MKFIKTFQNSFQIYEKTFNNYIMPSNLDEVLDINMAYPMTEESLDGYYDEPEVLFKNFDVNFFKNINDECEKIKEGDWVLLGYDHLPVWLSSGSSHEDRFGIYLCKVGILQSRHPHLQYDVDDLRELGMSHKISVDRNRRALGKGHQNQQTVFYSIQDADHVVKYSTYINKLAGVPDIMKKINEARYDNYIAPSKLDEELDENNVYALTKPYKFDTNQEVLFKNFDGDFLKSLKNERDKIKHGDWAILTSSREYSYLCKMRTYYGEELGISVNFSKSVPLRINEIFFSINDADHVVKYSTYINKLAGVPDIMKTINENAGVNYIAPSKLDEELDEKIVHPLFELTNQSNNDVLFKNFDTKFLRKLKDERGKVKEGDWVLLSYYPNDNFFTYTYLCKLEFANDELGRKSMGTGVGGVNVFYSLSSAAHVVKYSTYIIQLAGVFDVMKQINENEEDKKYILPSKLDDELDSAKVYYLFHHRDGEIIDSIFPDIDINALMKMKDEKDIVKEGDWIIVTYWDGAYNTLLFKSERSWGELGKTDGNVFYGLDNAHHVIKYSTYIYELAGIYDVFKTINEDIKWDRYLSSKDLDKELNNNIFYSIKIENEKEDISSNQIIIPFFDIHLLKSLKDERDIMKEGDWILSTTPGINPFGDTVLLSKTKKSEDGILGYSKLFSDGSYNISEIPSIFHIVRYVSYISQLAGVPDIMKQINENIHPDIHWDKYLSSKDLDKELNPNMFYQINKQEDVLTDNTQKLNIPFFDLDFLRYLKDERDIMKEGDWVLSTIQDAVVLSKIKKSEDGILGVSDTRGPFFHRAGGAIGNVFEIPSIFHIVRYSSYLNQLAGIPDIMKNINEEVIQWNNYLPTSKLDDELDNSAFYHINSSRLHTIDGHKDLNIPNFDEEFLLKLKDEKEKMKEGDWVIIIHRSHTDVGWTNQSSLVKIKRSEDGMLGIVNHLLDGDKENIFEIPSFFHAVRYSSYVSQLAGVYDVLKTINEISSHDKMKSFVDHTLGKAKGGEEYFDIIDKIIKDPDNLDIIQDVFKEIERDFGKNFNIILTGGFGDRIKYLLDKNILSISGNVLQLSGALRTKFGNKLEIIYKKHHIDDQEFILFDDSYYSGSTKRKIDDYLKDFNSKIVQTYVVYDGSRERQNKLKHVYRYRDHHHGTTLPVEKLIELIDKQDLPKEEMYKKVLSGEIKTYDQLVKYTKKYHKNIQALNHREEKKLID